VNTLFERNIKKIVHTSQTHLSNVPMQAVPMASKPLDLSEAMEVLGGERMD
jgi:hypothetical protein